MGLVYACCLYLCFVNMVLCYWVYRVSIRLKKLESKSIPNGGNEEC